MDATGVSHIAICVQDVDKSLAFYRDILGMRVTLDQVQDTTAGGLPHVYHSARKTRRTVHLHFIRAEVIAFDTYIELGGESAAKAQGAMQVEGKEYAVADGDVIFFRTSA